MYKWFSFQDQNAGKMFADEAATTYERSITTLMKTNMLVYFAYADFEEASTKQTNTQHKIGLYWFVTTCILTII